MKIFTTLRDEFPDNWEEPVAEGMFALNPRAFEVSHSLQSGADTETEVESVVRELLSKTPKAKINKIDISFSPRFVLGDFGGTITVTGVF